MNTSPFVILAVCTLALLLVATPASSQISSAVTSVEPDEAIANAPLTIRAQLIQGEAVERVHLVYRPFGETEFKHAEMNLVASTAAVTLPSRFAVPPFLEYYFVLEYRTGKLETYPIGQTLNPLSDPPQRTLSLPIRSVQDNETQIMFLSPDPTEVNDPEDVVISLSLLRADSVVVPRATQIFLDGADVTSKAVIQGDLVVLSPHNVGIQLSPGVHKLGVRIYARDGNLYRMATRQFRVSGEAGYTYSPPRSSDFRYSALLYAESRHERVLDAGTWYNRAGFQFTGTRGEWRLTSNAFLTSDESSQRQPQNRFYIGLESPAISAGYGDAYPAFPNLILSGKRVRGLHSALRLGVFHLDLALGQTVRSIEGTVLDQFPVDSLASRQQSDPGAAYGPLSPTMWGKFSFGTYQRDLFAVRPSFGSAESWQIGFTWLSSKDKVSSIQYGVRPQENVVFGTDFTTRLDNSRIEFTAQAALSAYNSDVSSGNFTDAYIDSVYPARASDLKWARDMLSSIITVNENLIPLSFKTLPTLAYDIGLSLAYFDNTLRCTYLYRGSDYISFGQTFLRKDIRGFNISDRARFFSNQVLLTLGYERLEDNNSNSKVATTVFSTLSAALSYYSRSDLPSATIGVSRLANDNSLPIAGPVGQLAIDDETLRFFLQSSYDFTLHGRHTAILNLSTSNRDDKTLREYDISNRVLSLGVTSRYSIPLQTTIDVGYNVNRVPADTLAGTSGSFDYTVLTLAGRYSLIPDVLSLTATVAPTMGALHRTLFSLDSDWLVMPTMTLTLQFSYFRNRGMLDEHFLTLRYRYDL